MGDEVHQPAQLGLAWHDNFAPRSALQNGLTASQIEVARPGHPVTTETVPLQDHKGLPREVGLPSLSAHLPGPPVNGRNHQ
ncbi:MAG: hypothetical protein EBU88_02770 [Acidobacteria bacterium]|nr:hypothetical protein [Acidobacteriota bacterium]